MCYDWVFAQERKEFRVLISDDRTLNHDDAILISVLAGVSTRKRRLCKNTLPKHGRSQRSNIAGRVFRSLRAI